MVRRIVAERFAVYLVSLDPTVGAEMRKTRPCVVISPVEMHETLLTVIIAPMTTSITRMPTRVPTKFDGVRGEIALDQMRSVDYSRLRKHLGRVDEQTARRLLRDLATLFA